MEKPTEVEKIQLIAVLRLLGCSQDTVASALKVSKATVVDTEKWIKGEPLEAVKAVFHDQALKRTMVRDLPTYEEVERSLLVRADQVSADDILRHYRNDYHFEAQQLVQPAQRGATQEAQRATPKQADLYDEQKFWTVKGLAKFTIDGADAAWLVNMYDTLPLGKVKQEFGKHFWQAMREGCCWQEALCWAAQAVWPEEAPLLREAIRYQPWEGEGNRVAFALRLTTVAARQLRAYTRAGRGSRKGSLWWWNFILRCRMVRERAEVLSAVIGKRSPAELEVSVTLGQSLVEEIDKGIPPDERLRYKREEGRYGHAVGIIGVTDVLEVLGERLPEHVQVLWRHRNLLVQKLADARSPLFPSLVKGRPLPRPAKFAELYRV